MGWDVGGAKLKAVLVDGSVPEPVSVIERPFSLWRHPERLVDMLLQTAGELGGARTMAVTMTAELADCFATKSEGVAFVVNAFLAAFPKLQHWFYAIDGRFRPSSVALARPLDLAATNWLAIASLVSRRLANSVLID